MIFKIKKYISLIFILLIIPSILVSCNNVKLSSDIKIKYNGDINTSIKLNYDDTIYNILGDNLFSIILGDASKDFSIKKYNINNRYIEEINIDTNIVNFNSDKAKSNNIINKTPSNFFDYNITTNKGFFLNTYTFKLSLNQDIMDIINNSIKNDLNNNLNLNFNSNISSLISGGISNGISEYIGNTPYELTIYTPVNIIDSNATEQIDNKTLKWNYVLDDLDENTELMVSFKIPNILNIVILSISVLVLLIILIVFTIRKKKRLA